MPACIVRWGLAGLPVMAGLAAGQPAVEPAWQEPGGHEPARQEPVEAEPVKGERPASPANGGSAVAMPAPATVNLERFTAQALLRVALIDLRQQETDQPRDYRLAYRLMEVAAGLTPRDLELAHRLGEAAWRMEDEAAVQETCRRILELDPGDTVTVLRMITTRLNATQTLEQRLAAYDRFLGPEGQSIDASVRSRLAMDAAQLRRERGDEKGFIDNVKLAAQLDPTNKEAAQEAALYFARRVEDPLGRMELISNLLRADPLDPTSQLWLAREMGMLGAFEQANRFHGLGRSLIQRAGQNPDPKIYVESLILEWQADGPRRPVKLLTDYVSMSRLAAERQVEMAEKALQPTTEMPRGKDVRLDIDLERLRILAAFVYGDAAKLSEEVEFTTAQKSGLVEGADVLESAVGDFGATVNSLYDQVQDPAKLPPGATAAEARAAVRQLFLEAQMIRAITNKHMDQVEFDEEKIAELTPAAPEGTTREEDAEEATARGWLELRKSGPEKALEILLPRADVVAAARLGVATCREMMGQKEAAAADYMQLAASDPMGVLGATARSLMMRLTGKNEDLTPLTAKARQFGRTIPPSVDSMVLEPSSYMALSASLGDVTVSALEPKRIRLRLKNISNFPLSMGAGQVIDTRFLLSPNLLVASDLAQSFVQPEVVGLDRRLRLMPGESLEADLWGEAGETGWMAEAASSEYVRLRWRVLQGFLTGMAGVFEPGIGCLSTMTETMMRLPLAESVMPVEELTQRVRADGEDRLPALVVGTRAWMVGVGSHGAATGAPREALARAWAERYPRTSPAGRMLILAGVPHAGISPEMEVLDEAARQETDPRVGVVVALTVCRESADPFLRRAMDSSDAVLKEVAGLQAARLSEVRTTYSRNGPGVQGILPGASASKGSP